MKHRNGLLIVALSVACTTAFVLLWAGGIDAMTDRPTLVSKADEPCVQLRDLPLRKAYRQEDIDRLCLVQYSDGYEPRRNPKRIQPE